MKTNDYGWTEDAPQSGDFINGAILSVARQAGDIRTVLDAGCGNGVLAGVLANAGFQVTGVDGDAHGVAIARQRYGNARFETWLFEDEPPGRFDLVVSTEVVEHLYKPADLARFCFAALRPGGTLAMTTPYHGYAKNLALSVFNKWDDHHTVHWDGGHIKFWSRRTLTQLLEQAGFRDVAFHGLGRLPYLWKSMLLTARRPG